MATKSGGTIETLSLYHALHQLWPSGSDYIAITDPGSSLQGLAQAAGYREVFLNPADIGGRFSAVSLFGLVPAVLTGVVVHDAISRIGAELTACREEDPFENPGVHLGAQLAAAYNVGRWQLRIGLGKDIKGFSGILNTPSNVTDKISVEHSIATPVGGFLILRVYKTLANSMLSSKNPKIVKVLGNMLIGGTILAGSGGALVSSAH